MAAEEEEEQRVEILNEITELEQIQKEKRFFMLPAHAAS